MRDFNFPVKIRTAKKENVKTTELFICQLTKNSLKNIPTEQKKKGKELMKILKLNKNLIKDGSVKKLKTKRAESLGLNVAKVEKILKYKMPSINQVCNNLIKDIKR